MRENHFDPTDRRGFLRTLAMIGVGGAALLRSGDVRAALTAAAQAGGTGAELPKMTYRKLGRTTAHRTAMFRNQLASLMDHEGIVTTLPKAKELRPIAEKLITKAKKAQEGPMRVHRIRQIQGYLGDREMTHKLVNDVAPRYLERNGGYTRILKLGTREGDNASMARIELV